MASVVITGGSGFIGTNLLEYFRQHGDVVVNFDLSPPRNPAHAHLWKPLDILDAPALEAALAEFEPDLVYHLAARTDLLGKTVEDYPANTRGVENLLQALNDLKPPRLVVFASSMLVCRMGYRPAHESDYCPATAYGQSKVAGECSVRALARGFPWLIVRPTSIWGPWFATPYRDFFTAIERGHYLHPKGYRILRSYGFVLNVVHQLACLGERALGPLQGRSLYLADPVPVELKHWADTIQVALGAGRIREVPVSLLQAGARLGDLAQRAGWRPPLTTFRLGNLLTEMVHDTGPLADFCGVPPYSMEEGVEQTCHWLRDGA